MIAVNLVWVVVAVAVLVLALAVAKSLARPRVTYPFTKRQTLFSPAERSFLGVLERAVDADYKVFAKVRVLDVLAPRSSLSASARQSAMNRINAKHFDFVLCRLGDFSIAGVVELDDASHERRHRQERDAFLVAACEAAGLPLVQVRAARTYAVDEVRARIMQTLNGPRPLAPQPASP
jgi:uncharacterized protein DUF2726